MKEIKEYLKKVENQEVNVTPLHYRIDMKKAKVPNPPKTWNELLYTQRLYYTLGYIGGLKKSIKIIKQWEIKNNGT